MQPLSLAALLAFLAAPAQTPNEPVVRVGVETRGEPWAFVPGLDYSKEDLGQPPLVSEAQLARIEGLDVDVMKALGRRMHVRMKVVPVLWRRIEAELLAKHYDLILNAWTPTPRTPDEILASVPYYKWGLVLAVRADDPRVRSFRDLEGMRVGHIPDPATERALSALGSGLGAQRVVIRSGGAGLFDGLATRKLDVVIFDSPYVRWRVAHDKAYRIAGEPLNELGYHVGVRRSEAALFERVQAAVKDLVASPEMEAIRQKWEGAPQR
jgi:polar amino acid transport system substrate-binding protein